MNERMKQLALQAKAFIIESEHAKIGEVSEVSFDKYSDLEKFAELIVRECADLCDRFQSRDVGMQPAECAAAVRKMFGVEL